ncbi:MAG: N-acetyltransferase [Nocardioidaceae bacterium]|nr:N-acetyltransferase [Nocardioidaceae bacterium]
MTEHTDIHYTHNPEKNRYEIQDKTTLAGFAEYTLPDESHVDFVHTEVDEAYGGQGLAGGVVEFALADVRAQGKRIIAHCPYVVKWLAKHPEYQDITDPAN